MNAVITGLGVVAATGIGTDTYWKATLAGRTGIRPITRFDASGYATSLGGEVPEFDAEQWLPSRLILQTDHWTHLAMAATEEALTDAEVDRANLPEFEAGVITSTSSSGGAFGQRELGNLWKSGPQYVSAYQSIAWFYAATTGQLSIRHGLRGPASSLGAEQAGGLDALAHARRVIRTGDAGIVVSGGTDASLAPYCLVAQHTAGRLSDRTDPARAYLPFDRDASGHVPGEGGAILIVEDADRAARRQAPRIYGRIAGYAATFDPPPFSGRESTLDKAILGALRDAGREPGEIDVVFADAMGTPGADEVEARTLTRIFGAHAVPVTAPKAMTGRLYAGGAALDVAAALLALRDQIVPPTPGIQRPAPWCELDLVRTGPRAIPLHTALVVARGHRGHNSAMVLETPTPAEEN